MEAFSLAVRRRIIELFQSGLEGDDVAQIMACTPAGARAAARRAPEEAGAGGTGGAEADAFCRDLAEDLHARTGVRVCRQTIGSWLAELVFPRKKSRSSPPSRNGRTSEPNATPGSTRSRTSARATSPA